MSIVYTLKVLKNGREVRSLDVKVSAGRDDQGYEWSLAEASTWFEEELQESFERWEATGEYTPEWSDSAPSPIADRLEELLEQGWSYPDAFFEAIKLRS